MIKDRTEVTQMILATKVAKGIKWRDVADAIGILPPRHVAVTLDGEDLLQTDEPTIPILQTQGARHRAGRRQRVGKAVADHPPLHRA